MPVKNYYPQWTVSRPHPRIAEISSIDAPFVLWVDDDKTTDMQALEELTNILIENGVRKILVGTGRVDHVVKSDVRVLRSTDEGIVSYRFNYGAYVAGKAPDTNMILRPGDTVVVPD